jgi:hypothetical protein
MTKQELKELLTPEFLSTLHTAVECCGWDVDMVHPSYCCPKCGENIGWLGQFFNFFIPNYHRCKND